MWLFCLQSLFREYGWQFLKRVVVSHPVRTARAVFDAGALDFSGDRIEVFDKAPSQNLDGARSIVGVGFCLKPMNPPCPSGRPNHDCQYLERLIHTHLSDVSDLSDLSDSCRRCLIREIGILALETGAAFYIMTSAKDILSDVYAPALDEGRFSSGLFVLCRYSLRPFAVGLLASGIRAWLFPLERGDCRDYRTWLQADRGVKDEQTAIAEQNRRFVRRLLGNAAKKPTHYRQFERQGNVLYSRNEGRNLLRGTDGRLECESASI